MKEPNIGVKLWICTLDLNIGWKPASLQPSFNIQNYPNYNMGKGGHGWLYSNTQIGLWKVVIKSCFLDVMDVLIPFKSLQIVSPVHNERRNHFPWYSRVGMLPMFMDDFCLTCLAARLRMSVLLAASLDGIHWFSCTQSREWFAAKSRHTWRTDSPRSWALQSSGGHSHCHGY